MDKTPDQKEVSARILSRNEKFYKATIREDEMLVFISVPGTMGIDRDACMAAYTADEARALADKMKTETAADYIYDLANVVDGDADAGEIADKWDGGGRIYLRE